MGISSLKVLALSFWSFILVIVSTNGAAPEPLFPAMFVFGDSIVDNGNNNYLNTLAKANYFPYGIDFNQGPTGRFCNGKTIVDFLGDLVGLPYLPPFVETYRGSSTILRGVNYASAAGGIMEETGQNLGGRFSLSQQVQNFETTLRQLKNQMNEHDLSQYLAKSLMFMIPGSNDYINNYLLPGLYPTSYIYDPKTYADLLIKRYSDTNSGFAEFGTQEVLAGRNWTTWLHTKPKSLRSCSTREMCVFC
ncbi:GDSL esterase/lipase [Quillaja saponaria]|uniref:GDSL esterase/lipase n=1 Tax=Quillaja saponaria TaxID=32244 RepID=A0AAD7LG28_QUISA|nr:GDSL esterase/lipase [Quillaja saponaria]